LRAGTQNLKLRDKEEIAVPGPVEFRFAKLHFSGPHGNTNNLHYFNKTKELVRHTKP